jgi:hypothetical protein
LSRLRLRYTLRHQTANVSINRHPAATKTFCLSQRPGKLWVGIKEGTRSPSAQTLNIFNVRGPLLTICFRLSFLHLQSGKLLLLKQTSLASATTKQGVNVGKLKLVVLRAVRALGSDQLLLKLRVRHATDEVQRRLAGINLRRGRRGGRHCYS